MQWPGSIAEISVRNPGEGSHSRYIDCAFANNAIAIEIARQVYTRLCRSSQGSRKGPELMGISPSGVGAPRSKNRF